MVPNKLNPAKYAPVNIKMIQHKVKPTKYSQLYMLSSQRPKSKPNLPLRAKLVPNLSDPVSNEDDYNKAKA